MSSTGTGTGTETGMDDDLATELKTLLAGTGLTVGTAESCTGGLIAHRITRVPGSSAYFSGGIVSYSNDVKHRLLGVPADVLDNPGAVSQPTARAMAEGARRTLGTDLAVATTGIAGPNGGTARKPVGLVYIALASAGNVAVEEHQFRGGREDVIEASATRALELLIEHLVARRP